MHRVDHTIKREPKQLFDMRKKLAIEDKKTKPNGQLQAKLRSGIDRLEDQFLGKVWCRLPYMELPPGQVFRFTKTRHKSEPQDIQPKMHHCMKGSDGAMIISNGMDQGTQIYLQPDRIVLTKGK